MPSSFKDLFVQLMAVDMIDKLYLCIWYLLLIFAYLIYRFCASELSIAVFFVYILCFTKGAVHFQRSFGYVLSFQFNLKDFL